MNSRLTGSRSFIYLGRTIIFTCFCIHQQTSDAAVQFGPIQRTLCLNLGPDQWFGSSRLLNLGLDLEGPVQQVWFG